MNKYGKALVDGLENHQPHFAPMMDLLWEVSKGLREGSRGSITSIAINGRSLRISYCDKQEFSLGYFEWGGDSGTTPFKFWRSFMCVEYEPGPIQFDTLEEFDDWLVKEIRQPYFIDLTRYHR